ncbi:MAG TPA: nuclear transport factor 2 family protein [Thermoleophilaceae bacterium]
MATATRSDANLALARQLFDWFTDHDIQSFMSVLAPDVEAHPSIAGAPVLTGREAVAEWWSRVASAGGEVEARPLDFEARGDCVVVRGYLRHRSGRTLAESQVYWLYEIRDGQIVRMESHPTRPAALAACR